MEKSVVMLNGFPLRGALLRSTALAGVAVMGLGAPAAAQVCDYTVVPLAEGCEAPNAGLAVSVPTQPNTEVVDGVPAAGVGPSGFSISIDNEPFAGGPVPDVPQRDDDLRNAANGLKGL